MKIDQRRAALQYLAPLSILMGAWNMAFAQGISCDPPTDPQIEWQLADDFEDLAVGGFFEATVRRCLRLSYTVGTEDRYSVISSVSGDIGFTTLNRTDQLLFSALPAGANFASLSVRVLDGSGRPAGPTPVRLQGFDASGKVVVDQKRLVGEPGRQFDITSEVPLKQIGLRVIAAPRAPGVYVFASSFKLRRDSGVLP